MEIIYEIYLFILGWPKNSFRFSSNTLSGFPDGSGGKEFAFNADPGSTPWLERSLGEGNGYPLQYSCLENSMSRGTWWATIHRVAESDTTELLTFSLF